MELRLLIVEDDRLIAEAAADYFTGKGWLVQTTEDGLQALELLKVRCFHLVLLDVMISGLDGFNVCRQIRKDCDVPIIFITARVLEEDKLNGYSLGADDYVTKPFSLPVLYAKAMALTGRVQGFHSFVELGGLKVDTRSRKVWRFGEILVLPPKEYEMLLFLIQNPGRVYSREQLLIRFWGYDFDGNERVVDNHIKKLRKALGSCGCTIETVRKFGYRLSEAKMEVVR
ncbi:MAG: response regulator transcription factor [Dorea sp.]|nr:response regulator transcription factor [Dorea sp.]